jgi:hypothetical protein
VDCNTIDLGFFELRLGGADVVIPSRAAGARRGISKLERAHAVEIPRPPVGGLGMTRFVPRQAASEHNPFGLTGHYLRNEGGWA